jgi:hypothetical protein
MYGAAALGAVTALAGCGGTTEGPNAKNFSGGDQKKLAQVVDDLQSAARSGDTAKICKDIFIPRLSAEIAKLAKTTCRAKVGQELPHNETISLRQVAVTGATAVGTVTEQTGKITRLTFVKQSGQWKISGIQ